MADDPKDPTPQDLGVLDPKGSSAPSSPVRPVFSQRNRTELLGRVHTRGWITPRDFATSVADVTYQTVNTWIKQGMIKVSRVGGIRRIYEEEVGRFLREGTLPPDPEIHEELRNKRRPYEQEYHRKNMAKMRKQAYAYRGRSKPK